MVVFWMAAIFILIPLILGLLSVKYFPLLAFICGIMLLFVASFFVASPSVVVSSYYNSTSAVWVTNTEDIPFMPTSAILLIALAILIILGSSIEIWRY